MEKKNIDWLLILVLVISRQIRDMFQIIKMEHGMKVH